MDDQENLYGFLIEYEATSEFKAEAERQVEKERRARTTAMRTYNKRYSLARKLRGVAKLHRRELYDKQDGLCALCLNPLGSDYEIDHVVPISKGGDSSVDNSCVVPRSCNALKGAKLEEGDDA